MKMPNNIEQLVMSSAFDYAEFIGEWRDCNVYRLFMNDASLKTGVPVMIIENRDGECRYCNVDEVFEIYDAIYI